MVCFECTLTYIQYLDCRGGGILRLSCAKWHDYGISLMEYSVGSLMGVMLKA